MSEHLFVAVVGIFTLILLALLLRPLLNAAKKQEGIFNELANKFNGKVNLVKREFNLYVTGLTFSHQGIDILFCGSAAYSKGVAERFFLEAEMPNIKKHKFFLMDNTPFNLFKIKGVEANFNLVKGFRIYCSNTTWFSNILTPDMQQKLNDQKDFIEKVSFSEGKFKVRYFSFMELTNDVSKIEELINTALQLINNINAAS